MSIGLDEIVESAPGARARVPLKSFLADQYRVTLTVADGAYFSRFRFDTTGALWIRSGEDVVRECEVVDIEDARRKRARP